MEKDRSGWLRFGTCAMCGSDLKPVYYYARTKEFLCEHDKWAREREVPANQKIKNEEKMKETWDELTSLMG